MKSFQPWMDATKDSGGTIRVMVGLLLILGLAGCGATANTGAAPPQPAPQNYFAPSVVGRPAIPEVYTIDDVIEKFSQTTYTLAPPGQQGPQVLNAGMVSMSPRGLLSLGITTSYALAASGLPLYVPVPHNPPLPGSFALELAGQSGGLVQLVGYPAQPMVAATNCPTSSTPVTYQFITLPGVLVPPGAATLAKDTWDPTSETAYGSVDISSSGSSVAFQNIHQFTLPSVGGTGAPAQSSAPSQTGLCGPTFFGNTVNVPGQLVVPEPGLGLPPPQASIGISSSNGMLVEDNGNGTSVSTNGLPLLHYENVLGAGTGAVGLPQPSSAVDTGVLVGAQYLGFIYAAGAEDSQAVITTASSSHLASFGFTTVPSSCPAVPTGTGTLIYGGDFTNDDPTTSPDGFGNCDFAIDLGTQDASSNGLYSHATAWVFAGYAGNITGATYSFPAVAIAGQVGGKYAVFLIGVDSVQPWAIYLLQSN